MFDSVDMNRARVALPDAETSRWHRVSAIAYRGLAVPLMVLASAIFTAAAFAVCLAWIVLPFDLRPDGPTCSYQDDAGSEPSGIGTEHIEWGLFPDRVLCCIRSSETANVPR